MDLQSSDESRLDEAESSSFRRESDVISGSRRLSFTSTYSEELSKVFGGSTSFPSTDNLRNRDGSIEKRPIDLRASFTMRVEDKDAGNISSRKVFRLASAWVFLWKVAMLGLFFAAFLIGFLLNPEFMFFGYLTNWSFLFGMGYSIMTFYNTVFPLAEDSSGGAMPIRARITQALFTAAVVTQMGITFVYWALVYPFDKDPSFRFDFIVLFHGGFLILVLVDGLLLNSIPVRMFHWLTITLPIFLLFLIWTVLQSSVVFDIDNPYVENDDKVYPLLDWAEKPWFSFSMSCIVVFLITPIAHSIAWALSLAGRRYIASDSEKATDTTVKDVEDEALDQVCGETPEKTLSSAVPDGEERNDENV